MLTGYLIIIEQDTNPKSLTYGTTRERRVLDEDNCIPGTDVAQWEITNQYCEIVDGMQNGYHIVIYTDVNPNSATYSQQRTEREYDTDICTEDTTDADWQNVGETSCEQILYSPGNVYGNSGYELQEQMDVNEFSETYNTTRTIRTQNLTNCPLPNTSPVYEIISEYCETKKKNNALMYTGYKIVTRLNTNRYSSSYTGIAEISQVQDLTTCPMSDTNPNWVETSRYCEVSSGANTGYVIIVQKDVNPLSDTYNQTQNSKIKDEVSCPTGQQPSDYFTLDFEIVNGLNVNILGGRIRLNTGDIDIEFDNTIVSGSSMIGVIQVSSTFKDTPLNLTSASFIISAQSSYTTTQTPANYIWSSSTASLRFNVRPS